MMLTKSAYVILGLLAKEDCSGYTLKRIIGKTRDFYWSESNAQIYPILKKLEKDKLVTSKIDEKSGARYKRIFSITQYGIEHLKKWLEKDCELALNREEFLLQLSLSQHLPKAKVRRKILFYQQSVESKLRKLQAILNHIIVDHEGRKDQPYLLLTYGHIQWVLEAKLKWCGYVLNKMKTHK